jgi:hypothetical protein
MRMHLLVLLVSLYRINGHGQHDSHIPASPGSGGQQPHISRKMEDHVHDIKYKSFYLFIILD